MKRARWLVLATVVVGLAFPGVVLAADPTADALTPTTNEDTLVTIHLSADDADGDTLTFATSSSPSNGNLGTIATAVCDGLVPNHCTADVDYTPDANYNGSDSFNYHANDGTNDSLDATVTIDVVSVNDAPSFTKGSNRTVAEDSGTLAVSGWPTNASPGPTDESGQSLSYVISSDDHPEYFSAGPAVDSTGELSFTVAKDKNGVATVGVKIQDSGSGTPPNVNLSAEQTFTITITPVNDPPTPQNDLPNLQVNDPATALHVLANDNATNPDGNESLTITAVDTTGTVGTVVNLGSDVTYQPPAGWTGSTTFTYTVQDAGLLTGQATVLVTVGPDTRPPAVTAPLETIYTARTLGVSTVALRIGWRATDTGSGVAKVDFWRQVDGGVWQLITLPSPTATAYAATVTVGHTYRFRVRATDHLGHVSPVYYGPTFKVFLYQENSPAIVYSAPWGTYYNASNSASYTRYSYGGGLSATLTVSARDVAFVAPTSSVRGSARIYLDGVWVSTISEKSPTSLFRQVLWSAHFSAVGTHTIRIFILGNGKIDLDCFVVLR